MELRLVVATFVGMAVGLNRELHGKPIGMRTLGLVSLGAALVSVVTVNHPAIAGHPDALSRVIQGIIQGVMAGIGFIGAGAILRRKEDNEVHNLTTAATVWVTAALGIACALAAWAIVITGTVLALLLLTAMRFVEGWLVSLRHRRHEE
nr:MgtC/SapB family protein [Prosthecomicrobium pneumaticum]